MYTATEMDTISPLVERINQDAAAGTLWRPCAARAVNALHREIKSGRAVLGADSKRAIANVVLLLGNKMPVMGG